MSAADDLLARLLLPEFTAERGRITTIGKVKNPGGILGNMSPHSVEFEIDGVRVVWPRAEQLFQAMRFPADHMIRELMFREANPMRAKMAATWLTSTRRRSSRDTRLRGLTRNGAATTPRHRTAAPTRRRPAPV